MSGGTPGRRPMDPEVRAARLADLRAAYEAGATIRELKDRFGFSYGYTQQMLKEAGTTMRPRGLPFGYEYNRSPRKGR